MEKCGRPGLPTLPPTPLPPPLLLLTPPMDTLMASLPSGGGGGGEAGGQRHSRAGSPYAARASADIMGVRWAARGTGRRDRLRGTAGTPRASQGASRAAGVLGDSDKSILRREKILISFFGSAKVISGNCHSLLIMLFFF